MVTKPKGRTVYRPKTRSGCITCRYALISAIPNKERADHVRERHVKCDEKKPHCNRCKSIGKACGGYDTIRLAQATTTANGELTLAWVRPSESPPDICSREREAFQYFQLESLQFLPGHVQSPLWSHHVLQLSRSEPAVWHAAIALASIEHESRVHAVRSRCFALEQYSKAMKALRCSMVKCTKTSPVTALIVCLLFIAFEFQQGREDQASKHLSGGLQIVRDQLEGKHDRQTDGITTELIEAFERLDIQESLYASSRVTLHRGLALKFAASSPPISKISSYLEARRTLIPCIAAMRELWYHVEIHMLSPNGLTTEALQRFRALQSEQLRALASWEERMPYAFSQLIDERERQAARVLQMHHLACKVMLATCLADGREVAFDEHIADFEHLVQLVTTFNDAAASAHEHGEQLSVNSFLDMGIIPPLYYAAIRCREPATRHALLDLLSICKHREGAWDGPFTARMARSIIAIEEEGLILEEASDVPEARRLHNAFFSVNSCGQCIVACRRRCFEEDGRWIEYNVEVDADNPSRISNSS